MVKVGLTIVEYLVPITETIWTSFGIEIPFSLAALATPQEMVSLGAMKKPVLFSLKYSFNIIIGIVISLLGIVSLVLSVLWNYRFTFT